MKQIILSSILFGSIALGLSACGGSSSSTSSTTVTKFNGTWINACEYDAEDNTALKGSVTIAGNAMTGIYEQYVTQDCSGTPVTMEAIFDLNYSGEFTTSTCLAEKTDATVLSAKLNNVDLSTEALNVLLENTDVINSTQYDLLCIDADGALRSGDTSGALDGSSATKRPIEMDMTGAGAIKQ